MLMHLYRLACIHSTLDKMDLCSLSQGNMGHIEGPGHGTDTAIRCWLVCSWYQLKTCPASGINIT